MIENIKDAIVSRMTNVLVGSFFISVAVMNSRGILIFIYSDKSEKLNILKNWQLNCVYDLIIPLLLTIFYTAVIPFISSLYKKRVTNRIYEVERDAERDWLSISLDGMKEIAIKEAETTKENADLYVKSKIKEWEDEREKTISQLNEHKKELQQKIKIINDMEDQINESKEDAIYFGNLYDRAISSINGFIFPIHSLNKPSPSLSVSLEKNQIEYKDHIILMFAECIEQVIKRINESPSAPRKEWNPPIDERITSALSEYIETLRNNN
ncbi:hypothetical protein [Aeromonas caviae]|uniref:hypothetical protein n=1 Tax=Aeromonas TaxID=642 RepID=UPI002B47EC5C|nr:hypothetical protein [Aeromonas caviae]